MGDAFRGSCFFFPRIPHLFRTCQFLNDSLLVAQQETAQMTIAMLLNLQRAMLDPTMPQKQRQVAINTMIAMGEGYRQMQKTGGVNRVVVEESSKNTGDL
jgi:hypothetical protein